MSMTAIPKMTMVLFFSLFMVSLLAVKILFLTTIYRTTESRGQKIVKYL